MIAYDILALATASATEGMVTVVVKVGMAIAAVKVGMVTVAEGMVTAAVKVGMVNVAVKVAMVNASVKVGMENAAVGVPLVIADALKAMGVSSKGMEISASETEYTMASASVEVEIAWENELVSQGMWIVGDVGVI